MEWMRMYLGNLNLVIFSKYFNYFQVRFGAYFA